MIRAELYTKVEFNEEDRKRIEDAILVMRNICDAVNKVGNHTEILVTTINSAAEYMQEILDGQTW